MSELPYQAEYAKTGKAGCKGCKEKINQGDLRIAVMVQSAFFDGKQPNWHHEQCFFKKQRPKSADDIANFIKLRDGDQKRIKQQIANLSGLPEPETTAGKKGKKRKEAAEDNLSLFKDFAVEYAKSSRATCKVCEIKICKNEVRVSKTVFDTEVGKKYGGQALWHHVKCFAEERTKLLYFSSGENLPGFEKLSEEDQNMVKEEIKEMKEDEVPVKKIKEVPKDENQLKQELKVKKAMEMQNKFYFKYRDALSKLDKPQVHELLEANSQDILMGMDECLNHLADCMAFGSLERCTECNNGQLILDNFGYKCTGNVTEWTKCSHVTQTPKRKLFVVPTEWQKVPPFKNYKPAISDRIFTAVAPTPSTSIVKKEESNTETIKKMPNQPLKNLQFFIYGSHKKTSKEDLKHRILKMGGLVVSKLTDTTAAVVSSKLEIEKMSPKMTEVKEKDIEVVDELFLDLIDLDKGTIEESLQLIKENNIAPWGNDPKIRIPQDVVDGKAIQKSGSQYVDSKSASTKLKVKDGTAVDPESGLADVAHVLYDHYYKLLYTTVLIKTDIVTQTNSYYKLQVLEADDKSKFWLFRSWGRIGTTVGTKKVEEFSSKNKVESRFESLFRQKTNNLFYNKNNFVKHPDSYYPVELDYGDADIQAFKKDPNCGLPMPVQELVINIFDTDLMKKILVEFELDTEKMPLGKLSKEQIKNGYLVLTELLDQIGNEQVSKNKIIDATNRFYTLIPHSFGMENPPLLDKEEKINKKKEMLDNLLEIETAYNLIETEPDKNSVPIVAQYMKLKSDIVPIVEESPEFALIKKYLTNTHAATHSNYGLEIQHIFKVVREGENERFKPFKNMHNRRLLWHGSRITNFAGILSQGLRIAPPEAPINGYMFGKGIYFADMASKSANYCRTDVSNSVGVILLCEVALGNMKECRTSEYVTTLPSDIHSVWGMGCTQPDPQMNHVLDDGVIVPLGTPVDKVISSSLLYNEFIVYDVAQVNVKYLLQLKFKYKF